MSGANLRGPAGILRLLGQYVKFGSVGGGATLVHVSLFSLLIEKGHVTPLIANVQAFVVAFLLSFVGHYYWTFADQIGGKGVRRSAIVRFLVTALIGLGLNTLIVYLIDQVFNLHYLYAAILMVGPVPLLLFALSKFWAFRVVSTNG